MSVTDDLAAVILKHGLANTNTPHEVLAEHMLVSLIAFEASLLRRADHKFYHPERRNEEVPDPRTAPVPRYIHSDNDEPVPGIACIGCED